MIYANREILLLNKKLDRESRREAYFPTLIKGASVYDCRGSSKDGSYHSETVTYKIRIPVDAEIQENRSYVPCTRYDDLADVSSVWTIHNDDLVIFLTEDAEIEIDPEGLPLMEESVMELVKVFGFQQEIIHVTEWADNTRRGSDAVRHWRIGGT